MSHDTVTRALEELLRPLPRQHGNGGHLLAAEGAVGNQPNFQQTPLDKTTAAVKLMLEDEARERAEKTARLTAARLARDESADR